VFGVGPQEVVLIVLLLLVIFGPGKAAGMARDFSRFVSGAQNTVEEFKSELVVPAEEEAKEIRRSGQEQKSDLAPDR
jgi:Sec-independent protein translocase protein TatA